MNDIMREIKLYRNNPNQLIKDSEALTNEYIDLEKITKFLKIELSYIPLIDKSAIIEYNKYNNLTKISINSLEEKKRNRFTLGRQIANYIYNIDFTKDNIIEDINPYGRDLKINPIERRSDKYSELLLLPQELFTKKIKDVREELYPSIKNLSMLNIYRISKKVSETLKVTIPTIIIRYNALDFIDEEMKKDLFSYHNY